MRMSLNLTASAAISGTTPKPKKREFYANPKNEAEPPIAEVVSLPNIEITPELKPEVVPIPQQSTENFRITDTHLGEGGAKTKYGFNIAAVNCSKNLKQTDGMPLLLNRKSYQSM